MFEFFTEKNFTSRNQSGFKSDESCINQLLFITHEINRLFDDGLDVVSLNISKASDKVRHIGLLYKLKQSGNLDHL